MTKNTKKFRFGLVLMLFLSICFTQGAFAQSGFTLRWDSEVGCLNYDEDRKEEVALEDLSDDECIIVCEDSTVNFELIFDEQEQDVASIHWESDGGDVTSVSSDETEASVDWPTVINNGEVTVEITMGNGEVIYSSLCIKVKAKPTAGFETANIKTEFYCSQTDIYFENLSYAADGSQIVHSVWDFGDDNFSSEDNPVHSYNEPGTYKVMLTVYDECGCSDTYAIEVEVVEPSLEISCPTVTCEGATETYTLDINPYAGIEEINCEKNEWIVEGGNIVQQGKDWVDVLWDDVDEDGFGYLYFDQSSCNVQCNNILAVRVPVVANEGTIQGGDDELCEGEQSRYSLPQWPTTDFEWDLYDSSGTIYSEATVLLDQRNEIAVDSQGLPEGTYTLRANYTNTLHGCGGQAEYQIHVFENLEIDNHDLKICEGDDVDFSISNSGTNASWTISRYGDELYTSGGNSINYVFDDPGRYKIEVEAPDFCSEVSYVEVYEIPSVANAEIDGPENVCPDQSKTYTFNGNTNGFIVEWEVDEGEFNGPSTGESVNIVFDEGMTSTQISVQLVNPGFSECISNTVVKNIERLEVNEEIISEVHNSSDPQIFCTSSYSDFSIDYADSDTYQWSIEPEQLASVSSGQGTATPTILFNELYNGQYQGTISVEAKVCGNMEVIDTFEFDLIETPNLTLDAPNEVCAEEGFDIDITSDVPLIVDDANTDMILSLSNGQEIVGGTENSSTSYSFEDIEIDNVDSNISISYNAEIINESCSSTTISGTILVNPAPIVGVSIKNGYIFCDANNINTILISNVQNGGIQSSLQWYHDGDPIQGETGPDLNIGNLSNPEFGSYYVKVTSQNGCETKSNVRQILQECGGGELPGCQDANETITFNAVWDKCGVIKLNGTYSGSPVDAAFIPNEEFTINNTTLIDDTSDTLNTYAPDKPGIYYFAYQVKYDDCTYVKFAEVVVGYQPALNVDISCMGNTYDITMYNDSPFLEDFEDFDIVDYEIKNTDTNDLLIFDSENDDEAIATDVPEGSYDLTLSIQKSGSPLCEITQSFDLFVPDASFSISPNEYCYDEAINLEPDNTGLGYSYLWEFQNGRTNTQEDPELMLSESNNISFSLTVTGPYGCSDNSDIEGIKVFKPEYEGEIQSNSQNNVICENDSIVLSYSTSGEYPDSYEWYHEDSSTSIGSSSSVSVSEPGLYTVWLFDENGCSYKGINGLYVNEVLPPALNATISPEVCDGGNVSISGQLSPGNAEYQVSLIESSGNTLLEPWTAGPEVDFTQSPSSPGDYAYLVEFRDSSTGCSDSEIFSTSVLPNTNIDIDYEMVSCDPYRIRVFVTDMPSEPGLLTWNNGGQGDEITVDHGGPFQVRFQPDSDACGATATVNVPKSPEEYMWIFPEGCFEYCPSKLKDNPYVIGPIPGFDKYTWDLEGQTQSGTGQVDDFILDGVAGSLDLTLYNGLCNFSTNPLNISFGRGCGHRCELETRIEVIKPQFDGPYLNYAVFGYITNPNNFPISLSLNSPNGTYIPSNISIPANGTYDFTANPIIFVPDAGFTGGTDTVDIEVSTNEGIICQDYLEINYPRIKARPATVEVVASPNPITTYTEVQYSFDGLDESDFKGASIALYNLSGHLQTQRELKTKAGVERFEFAHLPMGKYVVVFSYQGESIAQEILIKK